MSLESIEQRVFGVVREVLRVAPEKIMLSSNIKDDLGADSLDQVSLIMALEEEFKGAISDDEAKALMTVGDITKFIEKKALEVSP